MPYYCTKGGIQDDRYRPSFVPRGTSSGEKRCLKVESWCNDSYFAFHAVKYFYCWIGQANWFMIISLIYILYACFILISHLHNRYSFVAAELFSDDVKMPKFFRNLTIVLAMMSLPELLIGSLISYRTQILYPFVPGFCAIYSSIFYSIVFCFGLMINNNLKLDANAAVCVASCFVAVSASIVVICFATLPMIAIAAILIVAYVIYLFLLYKQVGKNGDGGGGAQELLIDNGKRGGGGARTGGDGSQDMKDFQEFIGNIFEIVKEEWERKDIVSKILFIPLVPIVVLFWLTIPTPQKEKYKRVAWFIHPILSSFIVMLAFTGGFSHKTTFGDDTRVLTFLIMIPIALILGIIIFFVSKDKKPVPILHSALSLFMIVCWTLYIVKIIMDTAGWNAFTGFYFTTEFYGAIFIGIGLNVRHIRSVKDARKSGNVHKAGMLFIQNGFFCTVFALAIYLLTVFFRWVGSSGNSKTPKFNLFGDIFDSRVQFFVFFMLFAVCYRSIEILTMKWRTQFSFERRHKYYGWHILAFYLILIVILDNIDFRY